MRRNEQSEASSSLFLKGIPKKFDEETGLIESQYYVTTSQRSQE